NKAQVSPQTNFVASTQYVNSTREPLSNIKPKDFYFTTANTNLDSKRFRVKYEDGTYSGYKNIESIEGIKDDSGVEMSKASIIYKETKNFTDIEVENNPGDITITFIGDPANLNAAAYGVNYTYETEYKKKLFTNFGINLITREEWGAPSYSEWTPQFSKITRVVVHHTATNVDFSSTDVTVRAIYNEHKIRCSDNSGYYPSNCSIDNTWSDIGYNYLIDPYGNIFEGRSGGNGVIGAHSIPNQGSIGISLLGNYSTTQPPAVMMASLTKLIGAVSFLNDFKVVWQQSLLGHRDYLNTECPGANIYPVLPQIAINSEAARQSYNASQNRDLIGKMSFGQDFIRSNPQITDGGGNSHVYLIADNIDAQMKLKIKSTSTWSGTNGAAIYGENVLVYINKSLAPAFIGEVGLSIPGIQFSTDLP
ncbi:MAG: peptidoglycan recognition family protein, partial [Candidatus Dojkabacteria bacterium]